jgi:hypothetical protein
MTICVVDYTSEVDQRSPKSEGLPSHPSSMPEDQ